MTARSDFAAWSRPPARERSLRVVSCPRSLETTKPPGRLTAPSAYTMPAWGTVTTSPGCSTILLEVSPVSRIRPRLTVMVFATGGGTGSAARAVASGAGELLVSGGGAAEAVEDAGLEVVSGAGVGMASLRPMAGGSE